MEKLKGVDFSHYQAVSMDPFISDADFFIHKITEGVSIIDQSCQRRLQKFADNKPTIVYHFMRNQQNTEKEIEHFISSVDSTGYAHTIGVAIDYEMNNSRVDVAKMEYALVILENHFKKKPILYCSDLHCNELYQMIRAHDYGLWIARYRKKEPEHACDFWQYSSKPYDKNYFYGGFKKILKYIRKEEEA